MTGYLGLFTAGWALCGFAFILLVLNIYFILEPSMFFLGSSATSFSIGFTMICTNYNKIYKLIFDETEV